MKKQLIVLSFLALCTLKLQAQDTTNVARPNPLTFSGYLEAYYGFDLNQPSNNTRPNFVYSHNRHNEVNINLGYVKANYVTENVRANVTLAVGSYMNANYAAEPGVLKNVYEANAGFKLSKKKDLWLDAGILPSHIGFESARSFDCWTLTRSIIADNSPYFESGVRLSYGSNNGKWYLAAMVLNGWQRIQRVEGSSAINGGTQITYKPSSKLTLNYSTFIGNDKPDSVSKTRVFHNLYGIFQITNKFGAIACVDYGMEQKLKGSTDWNNWLGTALILRYQLTNKAIVALRGEYYSDRNGVIIAATSANGFRTTGVSANFDYFILSNALLRVEGKLLNSKDAIFTDKGGSSTNTSPVLTTALVIAL